MVSAVVWAETAVLHVAVQWASAAPSLLGSL
jgi:hypothetical protein